MNRKLKTESELNFETIGAIYENSNNTLRSMVSLGGKPYDQCGVTAPLMAQLRETVTVATVLTEGRYEKTIPQDLWDLFIQQLAEIGKCSLNNYKRIPSSAITSGKDVELTIFTDASTSQIISAYLTYNADNGEKVSYLIL